MHVQEGVHIGPPSLCRQMVAAYRLRPFMQYVTPREDKNSILFFIIYQLCSSTTKQIAKTICSSPLIYGSQLSKMEVVHVQTWNIEKVN